MLQLARSCSSQQLTGSVYLHIQGCQVVYMLPCSRGELFNGVSFSQVLARKPPTCVLHVILGELGTLRPLLCDVATLLLL